jgi:predicted TIM-barrel fold metal-dependent hydrolase
MVHGHSHGRYLDDSYFWPILERAQELGVPLYIHPTAPPEPVIKASYSGNFSQEITELMATAGWGWHIETAIHILRIIFSGALDVYSRLQLIIGHLGEGIPFMLPRIERMFPTRLTKLNKPIGAYFRENIHYTVSGFNFTQPFIDLFLQVGVERIMFSADYPYSSMKEAIDFLVNLPASPQDKERIAHCNAERLLRI